jgi:hypothetical protein
MANCPYCTQELPPGALECPLCRAELAGDSVYELTGADADIPSDWQSTAIYTFERALRCPHCREPIRTVRVLRMSRTQVAFTSTLPRGGRIMACPQCERILSIELTTFT